MLKFLMGFPTNSPLILSDTLDKMTNESLFRFKVSEDMNLNNNIDIKIAENNLLSETLLYRYEKSKGLPKLTAFLNGNYTGNSESFSFTQTDQKWFGATSVLCPAPSQGGQCGDCRQCWNPEIKNVSYWKH